MPLSDPAPRRLLHSRDIELRGWERDDGLFDIEATLTDAKTYVFTNQDRGDIHPGEPLHRMLARMTVDEDMRIHAFEAETEYGPYRICPEAAPNFSRLEGLVIGRGFIKAANDRVGGVHGCTHLRELLGQMGTVAFQTLYAVRQRKGAEANALQNPVRPALLNSCVAFADGGEIARRNWPDYYAARSAAEQPASP